MTPRQRKWARDRKFWFAVVIAIPVILYYSIRIWIETVLRDTGEKK